MNRWLPSVAAVLIAVPAVVAASSASASTPPQGCTIRIENPDGHVWWARFSGTGSGGLSPLEEGVCGHGPLQVDGAFVRPVGCGSFAQPCVFLWAKSPQP